MIPYLFWPETGEVRCSALGSISRIEEAKAGMHLGDSNLTLKNDPELVETYELAERLYNAAVSECTKILDAPRERD